MKKLFGLIFLIVSIFALPGFQAKADNLEITSPDQLVECMTGYIQQWIVAPDSVSSWEHGPAYEFAGKYVFASWHTRVFQNYGTLGKMVGPKDDVYCDYQTKQDGSPDMSKPGFCRANVSDGDILFDSVTVDNNGNRKETKTKVAVIKGSKIFCDSARVH